MKFIKHLRNATWPSLQNSFHPYLLRTPALAFMAACLLLGQIIVNTAGQSPGILRTNATVNSDDLIRITNQARKESGKGVLQADASLERAAQAKAEDMVARDYWSHYAPDGTSPWKFINDSGYEYRYAGENLAKNFMTDQGVVQGWLQSPEHRRNLLDERFTNIGVATASGRINGKDTTVVVAMYGSPQPVSVRLGEPSMGVKISETAPTPTSYSFINPLMTFSALPTLTLAAVVVSLAMSVVLSLQHVVVSKKRLLWDEHIHPRPLLKSVAFVGVAAILLQSGFGVVG